MTTLPTSSSSPPSVAVDILILGAGWTSTFLIPLLSSLSISFVATSRTGSPRSGRPTIPFIFNPSPNDGDDDEERQRDQEQFKRLPNAKTVLVTFPIRVEGGSKKLVRLWKETHRDAESDAPVGFVQLGSTGIWNGDPALTDTPQKWPTWLDRHSPFDESNDRAKEEIELLNLNENRESGITIRTTVLNLSGLWGNERHPKHWVERVADTKEKLANKACLFPYLQLQNIHLIHGHDVARAILAVHTDFALAAGHRWLLTDLRSYDWWHLASSWSTGDRQRIWVGELLSEDKWGVRALPRGMNKFEKVLDSREFWTTFGIAPERTLLCA